MSISKKQFMQFFSLLLVLSMVLSACAPVAPAQAPAAPAGGGAATGGESWWAKAAAPYKGVTIHGVSESTPPSNYVKDVLAKKFEAETGIKVEFETTSWDQMYDKAIKDMEAKTGIYDFVYIEQDIIYAYLSRNFLVDITKSLKDKPDLKAPDFDVSKFTTFINYFKNADGDVFGVPMEAFVKIYLYRKDLFGNADIQKAFKDKYGRDLALAKTTKNTKKLPTSSPNGARTRKFGAPPCKAPPVTQRHSTNLSKPLRRPLASTTGASTWKRVALRLKRVAK